MYIFSPFFAFTWIAIWKPRASPTLLGGVLSARSLAGALESSAMSSQECDESVDLRKSGNWFITTGVLMIVSVYYHIDHHVMYYLQANRFFFGWSFPSVFVGWPGQATWDGCRQRCSLAVKIGEVQARFKAVGAVVASNPIKSLLITINHH